VSDRRDFSSGASVSLPKILAMKLGRPLGYDPAKREVTGDAEASKLLRRAYSAPWKHSA